MLDLQARVDLHEVEIAVRADDELDRAGVDVVDRARRRTAAAPMRARSSASGTARAIPRSPSGSGAAPSTRARQMDRVAVRVGEDLELDVARLLEVALEQHAVAAERVLASRWHDSSAAELAGARTMRMPLPPPPCAALIISG
jgi:hypothetical protein